MTRRSVRGRMWLSLGLIGAAVLAPLVSWAQAMPPAEAAGQPSSAARSVVAGAGAVAGTGVYAPFKALVMCPVGAVASGAVYAVTGGEKETPRYLLGLGCAGTYLITPGMIQGEEAFRYSSKP